MNSNELNNPRFYYNRELSWLLFDERILGEARDKSNPLLERLKFLSITASNLDEFFMIRVASLRDMVNAGYDKPDISGMTPEMQLEGLNIQIHKFVDLQYSTLNKSLLPKLAEESIRLILRHEDLSDKQKKYVDDYLRSIRCLRRWQWIPPVRSRSSATRC